MQLRGVPLTAVVDKVECIVLCCGRKGGGEKDADGGADAGRTGDGGRDGAGFLARDLEHYWPSPRSLNKINPSKHLPTQTPSFAYLPLQRVSHMQDRQTGGRKAQTAPVPGSHGASRRLTAAASALAFTLRPRASRKSQSILC